MRKEAWPESADSSGVNGLKVFVYADSALVYPPYPHPDDEDNGIPFTSGELRELAAELVWAADRLDSRKVDE